MTFVLPSANNNHEGDPNSNARFLAEIGTLIFVISKNSGNLPISLTAGQFRNNQAQNVFGGIAYEFQASQAAYDVSTDTRLLLWHNQFNAPNRIQVATVASGGCRIRVYSGTGSPPTDYKEYYVGGRDTPQAECIKGQFPLIIDLNDVTHDASSGTFDNTSVTSYAYGSELDDMAGTNDNWNYMASNFVITTTKASSDTPTFSGTLSSLQDAVTLIQGTDYTDKLGNWVRKIGDVVFIDMAFRIGNNSTITTFNDNGLTVISPVTNDTADPSKRFTLQAMRTYLNLRNNVADTATFSGTWIWGSRAFFDWDQDDSAVVIFSNPTFTGMGQFTIGSSITGSGIWDNVDPVVFADTGVDIDGSIFRNQNGNHSLEITAGAMDISDMRFESYAAAHAILIDTAGIYNLSNVFFDQSGTNDIETTHSSGVVTIIISNGGTVPTITITGAGTVVIINNVTVSISGVTEGVAVKVIANETVGSITSGDIIFEQLSNSNGIAEITNFNYESAFNPSGLDVIVRARASGLPNAGIQDDNGVFTDETTASNSFTVGDMNLLPTTPVVNQDRYLFGHSEQFPGLELDISTAGTGGFTTTWQYSNPAIIPTVTYSGNSFSVTTQETLPSGLAFNSDGTKFFIVGRTSDTVFEYTVSTGFDLSSTVAYSGNSFSVSTQATLPRSIAFNSDGTKFFIVGTTNDTVFEYTVSTGFDLSSTVAYSGNSFSVATEQLFPTGLAFNSDGTKFFIVGTSGDTVFEYTVSTGFDLSSTVAYSGNSFSVGAQENNPNGLAFNSDGTKFFITGTTNDTVFEYTVSTGFDLSSTVAYSENSFSVTTQENTPNAIAFNSDGTKFFIVGTANDTVFEYTVSVGFTLPLFFLYSGNSFSVVTQEAIPTGLAFNSDGTKFFIVGTVNDTVFEYTVSTGFDLSSTVAYSGNSFSVSTQENLPNSISFNSDGTKFFIVGTTNDTVFEYTVSTGFDLSSTVAYSGNSFSVATQESAPAGLDFNSDGTKFFIVGNTNDTVFEYTVSTGFDLSSTVAYSGNSFSITVQESAPKSITFNSDGTKFFIIGTTNDTVFEYTVSTGFDLSSTVAYSGNSSSVITQESAPSELVFNSDGTKLFIVGNTNDTVFEYSEESGGPDWFNLSTVTDNTNSLSVLGENKVTWTIPGDWTTTTINNQGPFFYIRAAYTAGTVTITPLGRKCKLDVTKYLPFNQNRIITSTGLSVVATWIEDTIATF